MPTAGDEFDGPRPGNANVDPAITAKWLEATNHRLGVAQTCLIGAISLSGALQALATLNEARYFDYPCDYAKAAAATLEVTPTIHGVWNFARAERLERHNTITTALSQRTPNLWRPKPDRRPTVTRDLTAIGAKADESLRSEFTDTLFNRQDWRTLMLPDHLKASLITSLLECLRPEMQAEYVRFIAAGLDRQRYAALQRVGADLPDVAVYG